MGTEAKKALDAHRARMIEHHRAERVRMANEAKWANYLVKYHDSEIERLGKGFSPTSFDVYMTNLYGLKWSEL